MAVISACPIGVKLLPHRERHRNFESVWRVITDDKWDGPITVLSGAGLPQSGDYYSWGNESDSDAWCTDMPSVRLESENQSYRKIWNVTYLYTTEDRFRCQDVDIGNPLNEPWQVDGDSDEIKINQYFARLGSNNTVRAITNTALESDFIIRDISRRNLTLTRNFPDVSSTYFGIYENSVNNAAITILGIAYAPRQLFMRNIKFTRARYGVCNMYYPTTFRIAIALPGHTWDFPIIQKGWHKRRSGVTGIPKKISETDKIVDKDGNLIRQQAFLDENGDVLEADSNGMITPVYRQWRAYDELNWGVFGFPQFT